MLGLGTTDRQTSQTLQNQFRGGLAAVSNHSLLISPPTLVGTAKETAQSFLLNSSNPSCLVALISFNNHTTLHTPEHRFTCPEGSAAATVAPPDPPDRCCAFPRSARNDVVRAPRHHAQPSICAQCWLSGQQTAGHAAAAGSSSGSGNAVAPRWQSSSSRQAASQRADQQLLQRPGTSL